MKIQARLMHKGCITRDTELDFVSVPRVGDLIHTDENGFGIDGRIKDVVWLHENGTYKPWLIIRTNRSFNALSDLQKF